MSTTNTDVDLQWNVSQNCVNCSRILNEDNMVHEIAKIHAFEGEIKIDVDQRRTMKVEDVLSIIYQQLSYVKSKKQDCSQIKNLCVCLDCSKVLQNLLTFYDQFNSLRELDSYLGRELEEVDKIIIQSLQNYNNKEYPDNMTVGENLSKSNKDEELQSNMPTVCLLSNGPWISIKRLCPQEIIFAKSKKRATDSDDDEDFEPNLDEADSSDSEDDTHPKESQKIIEGNASHSSDSTGNSTVRPKPKRKRLSSSSSKISEDLNLTDNNNSSSTETLPIVEGPIVEKSICHKCDKAFKNRYQLKYHLLRHDEEDLSCPLCPMSFITKKELQNHKSQVHSTSSETEPPLVCQKCDKTFSSLRNLRRHQQLHDLTLVKSDRFCCKTCGEKFPSSDKLVLHQQEHFTHSYPCPRCPRKFPNRSKLDRHVALCKIYQCPDCDKTFKRKIPFGIHRKTHLREKEVTCSHPGCGKPFKKKSLMEDHQRIVHTRERPFKCTVEGCDWSFITKNGLRQHTIKHDPSKWYLCTECGVSLKTPRNLREHMRSHNMETPFKCEFCSKSFGRMRILKNHILIHTGEKPHLCSTCGSSFRKKDHLIRHEQIHTGILPYKCLICGLCFPDKKPLTKHMLTHESVPDEPFL